MKYKVLFSLVFTLLVVQIVSAQDISVKAAAQTGYRIGPGDEITGKVLGEDSYNFVATVDQDGMIEVPFFDKPVVAKCRTERELRVDITKLLATYLKNPQLNINTKSNSRPPATVYGEVLHPDKFDLRRKVTLLEMISLVGGPTEAAGGTIQVFRTQPPLCAEKNENADWISASGGSTDVPSRLYSLGSLKLGTDESNPIIYPGDVIVVQKAKPVYVFGEVVAPDGVYIKENGLSLLDAIAKVKGLSREAKSKDIRIYRTKPNASKPEVIVANLDLIKSGKEKDIMLEPFDQVEVGRKVDSLGMTILKMAVGLGKSGVTSMVNMGSSQIVY